MIVVPFKWFIPALACVGLLVVFTVPTRASAAYAKWRSSPVMFFLNAQNSQVDSEIAERLFKAALEASNLGDGVLSYSYGGRVTDTSTGYDGRNVAMFRAEEGLTLPARTYLWSSGDSLVDADVVVSDRFGSLSASSACVSDDPIGALQDVIRQELGYALGLRPSEDASSSPAGMFACARLRLGFDSDYATDVADLHAPPGARAGESTGRTSNPAPQPATPAAVTPAAVPSNRGDTRRQPSTLTAAKQPFANGAIDTGEYVRSARTARDVKTQSEGPGVALPPVNTPPAITITGPQSMSVAAGASVTLSATATDREDGKLTASLIWTSSIVGHLGVGGRLTPTLPPGTHVIAATVTDENGATSSQQLTVVVAPASVAPRAAVPVAMSSPPQAFAASGYRIGRSPRVDLTWRASRKGTVDVYRDGARVATTADDGSWTDKPNLKSGDSHTYRICVTGTSNCSSEERATY